MSKTQAGLLLAVITCALAFPSMHAAEPLLDRILNADPCKPLLGPLNSSRKTVMKALMALKPDSVATDDASVEAYFASDSLVLNVDFHENKLSSFSARRQCADRQTAVRYVNVATSRAAQRYDESKAMSAVAIDDPTRMYVMHCGRQTDVFFVAQVHMGTAAYFQFLTY